MSEPDDATRFLLLVPYVAERPDGVPIGELCEVLSTTEEALGRLLDRACMVGAPDGGPDEMVDVYLDGDRVYVDLPQRFTRPPRLPPDELLSLLLALSPLRRSALPALAARARSLGDTLAGLAADPARGLVPDLEERVVVESPGAERPEHLGALERAVEERRAVRMEYYSAHRDAMTTRVLRPVALLHYRTGWYVLGAEDKLYKVERIRSLEPTDESFEPPEDLDLERYRHDLWGGPRGEAYTAELRVRGRVERWPVGSAHRFRSWLRVQRGQAVLLGPEEERRAFLDEVRALARRHEDPAG